MTHLEQIVANINALTQSRQHREPYARQVGVTIVVEHHATAVPSLLAQLEAAVEPSGGTAGGHRVPSSTPPCRLEAIDTLLEVDAQASQWIGLLRGTQRRALADTLRQLVGLAATHADDDQLRQLASQTRHWVTAASITTGWEVEAWKPNNTCPICEALRTLRIRVGAGVANALCVECRASWDWDTVSLLAEHIRSENADLPYDDTAGLEATG